MPLYALLFQSKKKKHKAGSMALLLQGRHSVFVRETLGGKRLHQKAKHLAKVE